MALILDTGPLYALLNRRDVDHESCMRLILATNEPLVIPAPVLVEVDQLVSSRLHPGIFQTFLDDIINGAYDLESVLVEDIPRIRHLCAQYADSDIGFVDASVLTIVERLNESKLATLDHRHFGMMRPQHVNHLTLLP